MQVSFRKASPEDAEEAVPLIYASGPDAFNYIFQVDRKGTAQDFLRYVFEKKGGEFGFDNHLIVEVDGRVAGIGACFSGRTTLSFMWRIVLDILSFYGLYYAMGVLWRGLRFEGIVRPPARKEYAIAHIAVVEELRGRGVGGRLIHQLIIASRALPPVFYILDVSERNPGARALYERIGFRVTGHTPSNLKRTASNGQHIDVPGHFRMELRIERKAG